MIYIYIYVHAWAVVCKCVKSFCVSLRYMNNHVHKALQSIEKEIERNRTKK